MRAKQGPSFKAWKIRWLLGLPKGARFQTRRPCGEPKDGHYPAPQYRPGNVYYLREALHCRTLSGARPRGAMREADRSEVVVGGFMMIWRWRRDRLSELFMPRVAARLFARCMSVRREALQDITAKDVQAEGGKFREPELIIIPAGISEAQLEAFIAFKAREQFKEIWDEIHGEGSWDRNPDVWAYEFEKLGRPGGGGQ